MQISYSEITCACQGAARAQCSARVGKGDRKTAGGVSTPAGAQAGRTVMFGNHRLYSKCRWWMCMDITQPPADSSCGKPLA